MDNGAKGKKEYIPHIVFTVAFRPNPAYEDYMRALEEQGEDEGGLPEEFTPEGGP